jgi:excinuclease UvrABC nuclease subunit
VKTTNLSERSGVFIGPVEDKHAAHRMIELAEGAFDLCRYYNVLVQSPHGKACAYKEMGKCPAPCDGTISMEAYRAMVSASAAAVMEPGPFVRKQESRMNELAADLQFERAAKVKGVAEQVSQFGKGPFRHARRLEDFAFVALQRGPREGVAKVFLIVRGEVEEVAGLVQEPVKAGELLRHVLERAAELSRAPLTRDGAERIGLVAQHLFTSKQTHGVFLRLDSIDEKAVARAFRDLRKQKVIQESEGEGVVKELQAM